jgi:hypothetical protein
MIRVRVHINDKEIIDVHAVRENVFRGMSKHHKYEVFETYAGEGMNHKHLGFINHKYSLGASRLSVRMLQLYYRVIEERNRDSE